MTSPMFRRVAPLTLAALLATTGARAAVTAIVSPPATVTVEPAAADGSDYLDLAFPAAPAPVTYTVTLSDTRKLGWSPANIWRTDHQFTWSVKPAVAATGHVYVGPPAAPPAPTTELYVYSGGTSADVAFENMIGRKTDGLTWFNDFRYTPELAVSNLNWSLGQTPKGYKLSIAIGLAFGQPSADKAHAGAHTLEDVAAGKLDNIYAALGASLVAHGFSAADVRLGWEEDGTFMIWSGGDSRGSVFKQAFQRASAALRATPGEHFTIWFNPGVGGEASDDLPPAGAYDGVAWDTYATAWSGSYTEPTLWADSLKGWRGIDSEATWPSTTTPYAIPEFGVGSRGDKHGAPDAANTPNGGDDGLFMTNALQYFLAHKAKFIGYWDENAGDYNSKISDASRPHEALAFEQLLGAGHLPQYLAGATLYTGPIKISTPGMRQVVAQLANGHVAALMWGDTATPTTLDIAATGARTMTLYHPLTGVALPPWSAAAGCKGYAYAGGLTVIELTP